MIRNPGGGSTGYVWYEYYAGLLVVAGALTIDEEYINSQSLVWTPSGTGGNYLMQCNGWLTGRLYPPVFVCQPSSVIDPSAPEPFYFDVAQDVSFPNDKITIGMWLYDAAWIQGDSDKLLKLHIYF